MDWCALLPLFILLEDRFQVFSALPLALAPAPAAAPPIRDLSCDAMFPDVEQEEGGREKSPY